MSKHELIKAFFEAVVFSNFERGSHEDNVYIPATKSESHEQQ